jgi:hypothetical protein
MTQLIEPGRRAPWGVATSIGDFCIGVGLFTILLSAVVWLPVALECLWKSRHDRLGHAVLFSGLWVIGSEAVVVSIGLASFVGGLLLVAFDPRRRAGRR